MTVTVRPILRYSPLSIRCEKRPELSFPMSVTLFSLATLLALSSIQEGLAAATMLNVLAMLVSPLLWSASTGLFRDRSIYRPA